MSLIVLDMLYREPMMLKIALLQDIVFSRLHLSDRWIGLKHGSQHVRVLHHALQDGAFHATEAA